MDAYTREFIASETLLKLIGDAHLEICSGNIKTAASLTDAIIDGAKKLKVVLDRKLTSAGKES